MAAIEIRSDFIRIARAFTAGASGVFGKQYYENLGQHAFFGIYVEPHPCGRGVQIVSSDRCALCVQWDPKGSVDRPRLIMGLTHSLAMDMSGAVLDDRWLVGNAEKLSIRNDGGSRVKTSSLPGVTAHNVRLTDERPDEPGTFAYPNWRHIVPSQEEIDAMDDGMPGLIDMGYMAILSRLYSDGAQNSRAVKIKHTKGPNPNAIMQFPWRSHMFVVIAPQINVDASQWRENLLAPLHGDPGDTQVETSKAIRTRDEDPASDL